MRRWQEGVAAGLLPEILEDRVVGNPLAQFPAVQELIQRTDRTHFGWRYTAHDVFRAQFVRMPQASRAQQVAQGMQGVVMELAHAGGLVRHVELAPAARVLGGDAGRAAVGMAAQ